MAELTLSKMTVEGLKDVANDLFRKAIIAAMPTSINKKKKTNGYIF